MNIIRVLVLAALFGALQAPVQAQLPEARPTIEPVQSLSPLESEFHPDPASFHLVSTLFGWRIMGQRQTTFILESGFEDSHENDVGRVALFIRNQSGQWVRSGSIDAPSGQNLFDSHMAFFNEFALLQSFQGALFYRRSQGKWKLMQKLTPPGGYRFTEVGS